MTLWYVDGALGTGSNNGTSWANAWQTFAAITWASLGPDDTLYISGGTTSQTYNTALTVGAHTATNGHPLVITAGIDPGHNGVVIIDLALGLGPGVDINGHTNTTVQFLTVQNAQDEQIGCFTGISSGAVLMQSLTVHTGPGVGTGNARGFDIRNNTGATITVQKCTVDTPSSTTAQADAIWTSNNTGGMVIIQDNTITINNVDPTGHSDGWQSYQDGAVTFRRNIISHPSGGANNHGIFVSDIVAGGTLFFYNNVINMGSIPGSAGAVPDTAIFRFNSDAAVNNRTGVIKIWNNTIYGTCWSAYISAQGGGATAIPAGDEFKNNLLYMLPMSYRPYDFESGNLITPANTDYNIVFWQSSGSNLRIGSPTSTPGSVRATAAAAASSLLYFEFQQGMGYFGGDTLLGFANASHTLSNWVGQDANSIGFWWNNGNIYTNSGHSISIFSSSPGDIIAISIDTTANKFWMKNLTTNTGWNNDILANQNPAGSVGGIALGFTGPFFAAWSSNNPGDYGIANFGATAFIGALPSGYSAYGSAVTWNPADLANVSLTPLIGLISNATSETWAAWQALGYDANGKNVDPLLSSPGAGNFTPLSGSPAIDAGLTIPAVTTDKSGVPRPQGSAFDMGAFELIFWSALTGGGGQHAIVNQIQMTGY